MKLSFDWLSEFVDLSGLTAHQVAEKLTMGAFEVEEVTIIGPDLEGPIVVGEILEIHQHPNADKIRLTKTRIKEGDEPLDIVCGAGNIEVGQLIPVALPGAKVINRHDGSALLIKASAIRGVKSNGMLCSPPELGIAKNIQDPSQDEGIWILNKNGNKPILGSDVLPLLPTKADYILHVEPRSNRGDALSVMGLAREVAALFGRPLKKPDWSLSELTKTGGDKKPSSKFSQAIVENDSDCPYITLRVIEGIKVAPSHPAIATRIEAIGMRTVNNVVDITNYVMHELGQPLHAYDARLLKSDNLAVRRATNTEIITTIDGKERKLNSEMLAIADDDIIVGVAGVMGGKDSEISDQSTSLVLEAACFAPAVVRRGSRLLGLSSDASLRFERGIDPASVRHAAERAAYLIAKYCSPEGHAVVGPLIEAGSNLIKPGQVTLRSSQIKRILGLEISPERIKDLLTPLGFTVKGAGETIEVSVPSFRKEDVKREIDLIEEVCRLNGYDAIIPSMPAATMAVARPDDSLDLAKNALIGMGLSEAWLSSLVPEDQAGIDKQLAVEVLNPLSKDHQLMRQSLVPGLINACSYNQDRGRKDVWLFEYGRVYFKEQQKDAKSTGVREDNHLAALVSGQRFKAVNQPTQAVDYSLAKGLVENLLSALNIDERKLAWRSITENESAALPWLHPYRTAVLTLNRPAKPNANKETNARSLFESNIILGYVGELHPRFADSKGLREKALVFELDIDRLKKERKQKKFSGIATSPEIVRDITADFDATDKDVSYEQVSKLILKMAGSNLRTSELVSVYKTSAESKKFSMTCRLTFQHPSETLTNEEIDKVLTTIRESLSRDLAASFRL
ncbi:phenylalanine--tRNA ligase subunit beta [bacterium]|nr:phenylalanine--tRNA ligase subunit beta [bacterium]MBP9809634.1 phenylalanine--tRNA ligase subunit beta [bacterium]